MSARRGFGVDGGLPAEVATELARRVEAAGYASLWTTDTPSADGLADLAAFAAGSTTLELGIGVAPVDRRSAEVLAARVREPELPLDRIWLGIGSGRSTKPLGLVRTATAELREFLPGVRLVVSAMGPKMAALAGEVADGVLLNWLVPARVEEYRRHTASDSTGLMMYVRTAVDPGGRERVRREATRYASNRAEYFAANGVEPGEVGVAGSSSQIAEQLSVYERVLDEAIVRALPASADPADLFAVVEAAAPKTR